MNTYSIEPSGKSWTVTKIVALIVAIASGLYMLRRAIAFVMAPRSQDYVVLVSKDRLNTT